MKKTLTIAFIFLFCIKSIYAQDSLYNWDENRLRIHILASEESEPAIILKDYTRYEYFYKPGDDDKNPDLLLYKTNHKIVRVNSNEALENFNKIYISMNNQAQLITIKARSINKNGEVIKLDENNIKEIKGEDDRGNYKIFAIEGAEMGSEIEYFYTVLKDPDYFGREYMQTSFPAKNVSLTIVSPKNLIFECKGYNNAPIIKDTVYNEKRILMSGEMDIEALKAEEYSMYQANLTRYDFKISYNNAHANPENRLFTWKDAADRIFIKTHFIEKKDKKSVIKFYKKINLDNYKSQDEKIEAIEKYVKSNILIREGDFNSMEIISSIISNKYANVAGVVKLLALLFQEAGINYEIGLTSERNLVPFDKDFDTWQNLTHYVFYFPETKKFLTPERPEYRYGMLPYYYTSQYGLFIIPPKETDIPSTLKHEIRFIPTLAFNDSFDNLYINVNTDNDITKADINIKRSMSGYNAIFIQPAYSYLPEDKQRTLLEELIKSSAEDAVFKEISVENEEKDLSPLKHPFTIKAKIESSSVIEKAGNKCLFKIGELIGPQLELYQEEERKTSVENDFNRLYYREISFKIPEGYTIKNLDDININKYYEDKSDTLFQFHSIASLNDNMLFVKVNEYYKTLYCPIEKFEEYRKVINAAADFNKITLVLEKIK